jgi:cob(I)alamin adenosyltransferase
MADVERATAAGSVDETSAFASACLATGEPTASIHRTVSSTLHALQMIAAGIRDARDPSPDLVGRLRELTDTSRRWVRSEGSSTLANPGRSMAAAMLRLARVTSERAGREIGAVGGIDPVILEFMSAMPDLLDALAGELDAEEERSIPLGVCLQG